MSQPLWTKGCPPARRFAAGPIKPLEFIFRADGEDHGLASKRINHHTV
jgi:hypothetical protein